METADGLAKTVADAAAAAAEAEEDVKVEGETGDDCNASLNSHSHIHTHGHQGSIQHKKNVRTQKFNSTKLSPPCKKQTPTNPAVEGQEGEEGEEGEVEVEREKPNTQIHFKHTKIAPEIAGAAGLDAQRHTPRQRQRIRAGIRC
jgi:hypothetical protein